MKRFSTHCLILAGLCAATPAAAAPLYELTITGAINKIEVIPSLQSGFDSTFSIGDPLLFTIVYDAGTPVNSLDNTAEYDSAIGQASGSIGDYDLDINGVNKEDKDKDKDKGKSKGQNTPEPDTGGADNELRLIQLINRPLGTDDAGDEFNIVLFSNNEDQLFGAGVGAASPSFFSISLQDPTDAVYPGAGTAPPALSTVTDFSVFTDRSTNSLQFYDTVTGDNGVAEIGFEITSVSSQMVPEPNSLALLGLGGLIVARRRGSKQNVAALSRTKGLV